MKRPACDGDDLCHGSCARGPQHCCHCYWSKHAENLQYEFWLEDSGLSWLQGIYTADDTLRIGCLPCHTFLKAFPESDTRLSESPYAAFAPATLSCLKPGKLKRHGECPGHQMAVAWYQGLADIERPAQAPAVSMWKSMWDILRKDRHMDMPAMPDAIGRGKARMMVYCLAEALRQRHREHLWSSTTVTLSMDGAQTRLLCRFSAVNDRLEVQRGVLGMRRSKAIGHAALLTLLDLILKDAWTDLGGAALNGQLPVKEDPVLDQDLYQHLRSRVVVWNSDAAGDEMLAAQESQRVPASLADLHPLFPNLTLVNRDRAHASRRPLLAKIFRFQIGMGFCCQSFVVLSLLQGGTAAMAGFVGVGGSLPNLLHMV